MINMQFDIKGCVVPVFTPINEDQGINYSEISSYVSYLSEQGVTAVLVGGTSGEASCFNVAERKKLSEAWLQHAKPAGMRVIVQVGAAPLPDVLELAKHAELNQADAILTLPELYFKPQTAEQLVNFLELISEAAPSLPLLYYHFPMMTGVNVNMKEFFKLACTRIPNFRGMKADLAVALQVSEHLVQDRRIFIGNHHLATSALLGHESSIATITNLCPQLVRDTVEAVRRSDVASARVLQERLNAFVDAVAGQGEWVPCMKVAMEVMTGVRVGPPRRPLMELSVQQKNIIEDNLRKDFADLFYKSL